MLPKVNEIELPSDHPMPGPSPSHRDEFFYTIPIAFRVNDGEKDGTGFPALYTVPGKIGVSTGGDDQTEMLLQLVQTGSGHQTPCPEKIMGVIYLNEFNAARLVAAITHWLASEADRIEEAL